MLIASQCDLPTRWGPTRLLDLRVGAVELLAQLFGPPGPEPTLARIHSACLTSEVLGSDRCDCARQLRAAQAAMGRRGAGVLIYTRDEGRGIGLAAKLAAYQLQDERGLDTIDANLALGLPADARDYRPAAQALRGLGLMDVQLSTNNPAKLAAVAEAGLTVERVALPISIPAPARGYLRTKAQRCGHLLRDG